MGEGDAYVRGKIDPVDLLSVVDGDNTQTSEDEVLSNLGTEATDARDEDLQAHKLLQVASTQDGDDARHEISVHTLRIGALLYNHRLIHFVRFYRISAVMMRIESVRVHL